MKAGLYFTTVQGQQVVLNETFDGMVSMGPKGREADRPLTATPGPYEVAARDGAIATYAPVDGMTATLLPE